MTLVTRYLLIGVTRARERSICKLVSYASWWGRRFNQGAGIPSARPAGACETEAAHLQ